MPDFISCAAIMGICYALGYCLKQMPFVKDNYIPVCMCVTGAILGIVAFAIKMPSFPAEDAITAIWTGIANGLMATGVNQLVKQVK